MSRGPNVSGKGQFYNKTKGEWSMYLYNKKRNTLRVYQVFDERSTLISPSIDEIKIFEELEGWNTTDEIFYHD